MSFSQNDSDTRTASETIVTPHPGTLGAMQAPDALTDNPDQSVETDATTVQNAKELVKAQNPWWIHQMTDDGTTGADAFDHTESDRTMAHALLKAAENELTGSSGIGWGDMADTGADTLLFTDAALHLVRTVVSERAKMKALWARENAPTDATTQNDLLRKYEPFVTARTVADLSEPDTDPLPDSTESDTDADTEADEAEDSTLTVTLADDESQADCMVRTVTDLIRDHGLLNAVSLPYAAPRCDFPVLVRDGQQENIGGNQTWRPVGGDDYNDLLVDTKFRKRDKKRRLEALAAECGLDAEFEGWD